MQVGIKIFTLHKNKNHLTEIPFTRYFCPAATQLAVRIGILGFNVDTQSYLLRLFLCLQYSRSRLCYRRRCKRVERPAEFPTLSGNANLAPVFPSSIGIEDERFKKSTVGDFAHA
jgi:hypothetical protein